MTVSLPLSGRLVVELSAGIAGAYAAKLLGDGGADVVLVEPPEGHPLRRWSASGADLGDRDGALFRHLAAGKQALAVDVGDAGSRARLDDLLERADVVLWEAGGPLSAAPGLAPDALGARCPGAVVVAVSPFGLSGPWSDRPATELTLQAWSGAVVGLGRGAPDRPPVSVGGQVGEWLGGLVAAVAALAGLARTAVAGGGELADVSLLEVLATCGTYEPVTFHDLVGRPFRTGRSLVTPGVETTSDGLVGLGVGTGQQWLDLCVLVGHPEWAEDRRLFAQRSHLAPEIAAWVAERTTAEVLELAAAFRIPHAPVGNGATVPEADQVVARGSVAAGAGGGFVGPVPPFRATPAWPAPASRSVPAPVRRGPLEPLPAVVHARRPGEGPDPSPTAGSGDAARPLAGLRVLDLTAFWAGPLCTNVLAQLGAEVLHVESTARPDGTRMLAGLRFSEAGWWERSGIFAGLNVGKQGITLDLARPEGRALLRRLADTCDVVVENFTPRVLEQIGLDLDELRAARPDLVAVRMPGFGLDGPWRDDPAFAFVIEDAAGLTWRTGHPDANPVSPYGIGDANAGLHAVVALLLALEGRRRTGMGCVVEASMLDAALQVAAEQVVEHSAYGALLGREGNRGPAAAPQNLYRTADLDADGTQDTWVALAVATDEQWAALRRALGDPPWAAAPELADHAGRRAHHDLLDHHVARWCGERPADAVVAALWDAGVPVARVLQPHEHAELPPLVHRGYYESVDHPVAGPARYRTLPFRSSRGPQRHHRAPAPQLGEHTDAVLRGLGVEEAELARLAELGVVGRVPGGAS